MSLVLNEWLPRPDEATTILRITGVYTIDVLVDTDNVAELSKLSWCYEQTKGQVYATDFTMEIPTLLGVTSPRVYLWKYIVYLQTKRVARAWKRPNLLDYRKQFGTVIWQQESSL
jgi:hypothetical protein